VSLDSPAPDISAAIARAPRLALLVDLDGTLIPFAATAAEATLDDEAATLLREVVSSGVHLVIVSGRPHPLVDVLRPAVPGAWWIAEHGAWWCDADGWTCRAEPSPALDALAEQLGAIIATVPGARLERKTASVCVHWRVVATSEAVALRESVDAAIDDLLDDHPDHQRLAGVEMVEVRPRRHHKGNAVVWVRERLGPLRIIAIGDDVTDEDMFFALDSDDLAIAVGAANRATCAQVAVDDIEGVRRFLRWLVEARSAHGSAGPPPLTPLARVSTIRTRFLVVSNRTPTINRERGREVGGLVADLEPALRDHGGVWLGWTGQERDGSVELAIETATRPTRACFDLTSRARRKFYSGFCNRVLWPLLHGFPGRLRYEDDEWAAYVEANELYADLAARIVEPDGTIWIHDYHLLLAAAALRHRGHCGAIGLFLHVPFPCLDVFETLPWARPLLDALISFDLIGVHTTRWAHNLATTMQGLLGASVVQDEIHHRGRSTRVGVFPIGIDATAFDDHRASAPSPDVQGLVTGLGDRKLLLGVDRLDYSKGIPQRLDAFETLLERHPRWRGRVTLVQVSVPSRADVPDYVELRQRVEHMVGRVNGRFGEADWVPVRYLYRAYDHEVLAQLYRAADVAVVTPLRDGMNLVAKEFVAAQDPERPGVLVLSQFAGAAAELRAAVLTNPYHRDGLADDLDRALSMSSTERRERHRQLDDAVRATTATSWAADFLSALRARRRAVTQRETA